MHYSALDIAAYFIRLGTSPLQLQKLLYYSQLWYYVKHRRYLFQEPIQAWVFGPVVYAVWHRFRFIKRSALIPIHKAHSTDLSGIEDHLDEVWKAYGHLSGSELVDLSHNELPWKLSRKGLLANEPGQYEVIIDRRTTADFSTDTEGRIPVVSHFAAIGRYGNY